MTNKKLTPINLFFRLLILLPRDSAGDEVAGLRWGIFQPGTGHPVLSLYFGGLVVHITVEGDE